MRFVCRYGSLPVVLVIAVRLVAQTGFGYFVGKVVDASGSAVALARITAVNLAKGARFPAFSSTAGDFVLAALPPGEYRIEVEKDGFKTLLRRDLILHSGEAARVDLALELGEVSETVTIPGIMAPLQTQGASTGQVIGSAEIRDLPLLGRNFLDLLLLVPGVTSGAGGNVANYSISGQREFANSIVVNGIEVTGNRNNDTHIQPSVEAVEEFQVMTSSYAAEFGRSGGGIIAVESRSGSNQFHGSVFEFLRNNKTTARTFFAAEPAGLKQNNFGGTLGGPLQKNRTFFFASYEGQRQRDIFSYLDTTVPAGMIKVLPSGGIDLSGLRDPNTGTQVPIFDPLFYNDNYYAEQFPGNVIPASRVSPAGLQVLTKLFPQPNTPGISNGWFNNFEVSQRYQYDSQGGSLRLEHVFNERNRVSLTYDELRFDSLTGDPFQGAIPVAGGGGGDVANSTHSSNHSLGATYVKVTSPHQLNTLRLGFVHTPLDQNSLLQGNLAQQFGIGNVNLNGYPATQGLPQIYLGFGAITGGSTYEPLSFEDNNLSLADHYTWSAGRHIFKFGYEHRHLAANPSFSSFPTGFQYYYGAYASLTSDPTYSFYNSNAYYGNGGSEIADLLLGLPGYVAMGLQFQPPHTTSFEHPAFLQDTWRVTSRITLDYGLRYEYQAPYQEANNRQANLDLAGMRILLAGAGGNSRALVAPDKNNFAPRVGLAWRVGPKLVARSGYGIFFTPEDSARSELLTQNYPFYSQQTFTNTPGAPFSYVLDAGVPRQTTLPAVTGTSAIDVATSSATRQTLYYIDPRFRTGYAQMFNLTVQREITPDLSIEAGYVGVLSHKLPYAVGNLNLGQRLSTQLGTIHGLSSEGNDAYHSLQLKAERRFQNYGFLIAYTYAKNLDNGPAPFDLLLNHQAPQDPFNLALEHAPASTDVRHNLTASYLWMLPFGKGQPLWENCSRVCEALIKDWQVNGITALRSGLPANVVRNGNNVGYEGLRPNVLRDPNLDPSQQTLTRYFDTQAFSVAGLTATQPGTASRNIVRGPGSINFDLSLFRNIVLAERRSLQLRVESFNVANHPHFANPNTDFSQGQFGTITHTVSNPRVMQFAAKFLF